MGPRRRPALRGARRLAGATDVAWAVIGLLRPALVVVDERTVGAALPLGLGLHVGGCLLARLGALQDQLHAREDGLAVERRGDEVLQVRSTVGRVGEQLLLHRVLDAGEVEAVVRRKRTGLVVPRLETVGG